MSEQFANNAQSTLAVAINDSITTLNINTPAKPFPTTGTFRVQVDAELMACTAITGNVLTVERGTEGTTAIAHGLGAVVSAVITKAALESVRDDLQGPTGPTGADSSVAGPTGPTGPTGADSSVAGPTGPTGPTGGASTVPGPTGPTGGASTVPGPTGPTGAPGSTDEATVSTPGLQSATGKRIENQSHESCKYQLLASKIAGFSAGATSADDWDGAVAGATWTADVAAHVRLLNQSTGVIYTLTTPTTCTATGETAKHGASLGVTDSAGPPVYRDAGTTGAAALALIAQPPLSNAIVAPRIPPNYSSLVDLALSTNAATAFSTITLPTLTASRNYTFTARVAVTMYVDSDSTGSCEVYVRAKIWFETNSSGVPINVTVDPAPSINNTDAVPTALLGVTANVAATTNGISITATRKSGIAMHASYECQVQNFKDVGAANVIFLPTDIAGLIWWHKSGVGIVTSGSNLVSWADSSGNSINGTVITDSTKSIAQYSATGGAGLSGARIVLAAGNPNELRFPTNCLNTWPGGLTAIQAFEIFKRAEDPTTTGTGGLGGIHRIGSATDANVVPYTSGLILDGLGSSARKTTGASTSGLTDSVCCYSVISTATEWTCRLNGSQLYTTATNTVGWDNSPTLWVHGDDPHTVFFVGEWYEDFAFDHKLSTGDLAKISGYVLTGKSGAGGFGVAA